MSNDQNSIIGGPCHPTVQPMSNFNPDLDAELLYKAMKGLGTNEKGLIDVLCYRNRNQRRAICEAFNQQRGKDLLKEIKSETSGDFQNVFEVLLTEQYDFYAQALKNATSGLGTNEKTLVEILCTLEADELFRVKRRYQELFKTEIEGDIKGDTSKDYLDFLLALCKGERDLLSMDDKRKILTESPSSVADYDLAKYDAETIANDLQQKNFSSITSILTKRNRVQIKVICEEFRKLTGGDLIRRLEKQANSDLAYAYRSLIISQISKPRYFAERLEDCTKGIGTKDTSLIRIICTRCDVDLQCIKEEYARLYGKSLYSVIDSETSGDYKKSMLAIIGN